MRRAAKILALALLIGPLAAPGVGAQEGVPTQEALDVLRQFVLVDCEVDEQRSALTDLVQHAEVLEQELGQLLVEGPDGALLEEMTATLERRWERRAAYLDSTPGPGFDDETLQAVLNISHEDFIEQGLRSFVLATREKAVVGLAEIGTRTAERRLRQAVPVVQDDQVLEMILGALQGRRLLERQQPASQRRTPYRAGSRRGLD